MTASPRFFPRCGVRIDPPARRLLAAYLVSLLLHGLLLFGLTGGWLAGTIHEESVPVYVVDLVHRPVLNPQAGRPEPRMTAQLPPAPAERVPVRTAVPSQPVSSSKTAARPADSHVKDALQKLRDEQALQQRLAALRRNQTVPADLPVGLPGARGNEAGVSPDAYVQATIQQNWALSPYLLADRAKMAAIEAWVRLTYSKNGRLEGFRFEKASGDSQFDESIRRALVKSQQLPAALPVRLEEVRVVFNLKAMAEARR